MSVDKRGSRSYFVPNRPDGDEVSVEDFIRVQQDIALVINQDPDPGLTVTQAAGSYQASISDDIIIADPSGGPVKIVLPVPAVPFQVTVFKARTSGNAVTVSRIDAEPFVNGLTTVEVTDLKSVRVACNTSNWYLLTDQD